MTQKPDAWMPFYVGDYLKDTGHLTREEHGGYLLLLLAAWPRSGRLPNDDRQLANLAKATPSEWRRLRPVLAEFFDVTDAGWVQKRLLQEFESSAARKAKAGVKAKIAAEKRWGNRAPGDAPSIESTDAPSNAPGAGRHSTRGRIVTRSAEPDPFSGFVIVRSKKPISERIAKHKAQRDYYRELAREEMRTVKALEKMQAEGVEFIRC